MSVIEEKTAADAPCWYSAGEASAWANGWNAAIGVQTNPFEDAARGRDPAPTSSGVNESPDMARPASDRGSRVLIGSDTAALRGGVDRDKPGADSAQVSPRQIQSSGGHVRHEAKAVSRATDAGVAPSPPETIPVLAAEPVTAEATHGSRGVGRTAGSNPATGAKRGLAEIVAEGLHIEAPKRGRPKKGEKREKPWEAIGISKASWYRRQKEKQSTK